MRSYLVLRLILDGHSDSQQFFHFAENESYYVLYSNRPHRIEGMSYGPVDASRRETHDWGQSQETEGSWWNAVEESEKDGGRPLSHQHPTSNFVDKYLSLTRATLGMDASFKCNCEFFSDKNSCTCMFLLYDLAEQPLPGQQDIFDLNESLAKIPRRKGRAKDGPSTAVAQAVSPDLEPEAIWGMKVCTIVSSCALCRQ